VEGTVARVGFDYATLETEFASDPKVKKLRRIAHGNEIAYHAAVGAWLQIVADTWHAADRFAGTESAANLPPELVEMIRRAGLIDSAHCIPESAFDQWIGRALHRRRDVADRVKRHRERKARVTVTALASDLNQGDVTVGNADVTHREGESEGELSLEERITERTLPARAREDGHDTNAAWMATLRDLYGPGGVFEGRPLPGQWKGKTLEEVERTLAT
jgi:hypothetical protein